MHRTATVPGIIGGLAVVEETVKRMRPIDPRVRYEVDCPEISVGQVAYVPIEVITPGKHWVILVPKTREVPLNCDLTTVFLLKYEDSVLRVEGGLDLTPHEYHGVLHHPKDATPRLLSALR